MSQQPEASKIDPDADQIWEPTFNLSLTYHLLARPKLDAFRPLMNLDDGVIIVVDLSAGEADIMKKEIPDRDLEKNGALALKPGEFYKGVLFIRATSDGGFTNVSTNAELRAEVQHRDDLQAFLKSPDTFSTCLDDSEEGNLIEVKNQLIHIYFIRDPSTGSQEEYSEPPSDESGSGEPPCSPRIEQLNRDSDPDLDSTTEGSQFSW